MKLRRSIPAIFLALLLILTAGCASQKEVVDYGPVPPMRHVMNYIDYLNQRLDLSESQRQQAFDIISETVDSATLLLDRRGAPGEYGSRGGGAMREAMRQRYEEMNLRMKAVLTKRQFKEFKRIQKEQREQIREGFHDPDRRGEPGGWGR